MTRASMVVFVTLILMTATFCVIGKAETGSQTLTEQQTYSKTYTNLYKGKQVNWTWSVDQYDLDFWIEDPTAAKYYQTASKSTDSGSFTVPQTGTWAFWWKNTYVAAASEDYTVHLTWYVNFTNKAPVANITTNATTGYAPMDVSFNGTGIDTDGVITAWSWNFGDSTANTLRNTTHRYSTPGDYLVVLTITDNEGATAKKNVTIHVQERPNNPPTVSIEADATYGLAPLKVTFKAIAADTDGNIVSYDWNFGDGNVSNLKNPVHTFKEPGSYTVALTVTDDDMANASDTESVLVDPVPNKPPSANIKMDVNSGVAPLAVSFTGSGTDTDGRIVKWNWSFGDGKYSSTQNVTHTFDAPNTYTVRLTVTDDDDATGERNVTIKVTQRINKLPKVTLAADRTSGRVPLTVNFTSDPSDTDGVIIAFSWSFGDGSTAKERNASHTFNSPGTYEVAVTVVDNDLAEATAKVTITVEAIPPDELDTDGDGMPDSWETDNGLDPNDPSDADADSDGDGLTNLQEYYNGTQADAADSDSDGMPDGWELDNGFDPLDPDDAEDDADEDGVSNLEEYLKGTDPRDPKSVPKKAEANTSNSWLWYLLAALAVLVLLVIILVVIIAVVKAKKKRGNEGLPSPDAAQPQPLQPEPLYQPQPQPNPGQPQYAAQPIYQAQPMAQYQQITPPPPPPQTLSAPPQGPQYLLPPPPQQQPAQDPYNAPISK